MAVYTTNIICAISMFDPGDETNDCNKEQERRGQILCVAIQVFCNDNEVGNATPNILDLPLRAVHGHVLITGQHDQALQVSTAGQVIVHGVVQVHRDDVSMYPPHDPETSSSATSSMVDMDQPLAIRNPEMPMAPFPEPDFLRLP
jgi:hypothetical protein